MIKILVKAAVLVCIVLSVFFIVNPSACSNLINGRVVNTTEQLPTFDPNEGKAHSELLTPQGDQPLTAPQSKPSSAAQEPTQVPAPVVTTPSSTSQPAAEPAVPAVTDTNSALQDQSTAAARPTEKTFTQADIDYAIASRYVELENEYMAKHKDSKNAAKEISYIVMDDFELTPAEWEAFLQRATVDNLFEKVRSQQTAQ